MTREEEIKRHAAFFGLKVRDSAVLSGLDGQTAEIISVLAQTSVIDGAEWADEHPPTLYVITRSEEHSDYVEKVFVDKEKAQEYCKQYKGDKDAYSRNITEINVTLKK